VELAIKRDCDTRWSSECDAVEAVCRPMQIDSVVDALEHLQDNACKNSDTQADGSILLRNILTYNFLVLLPLWRSVLQAINRIQKRLQDPKMNFRDAADDILGLKKVMRTRGEQFCVDAMQDGMKKCEEWNVEFNLRTRKRKKMPGELEADAALTAQEETRRVMKSALDTIAAGLDTSFQQLEYLHKTFGFLLDTETLVTADAIDLDDLQRKCTDFATAFPDDVDGARLVDEIQDCRILVSRRVGVDVTALGILKFIASFDENDVFSNLKVGLQILLTVSISVAGCERSFSKMKLIMTYLRSTMTEGRLTNLAILSVERETFKPVDFTKLIENFAAVRARKVLI